MSYTSNLSIAVGECISSIGNWHNTINHFAFFAQYLLLGLSVKPVAIKETFISG